MPRMRRCFVNNQNWSSTKERGTISDVTIDGFTVLYGNDSLPSTIEGYDEEHKIENVTISGLKIKGKNITSFEDGEFTVDANTTSNITIK